jgi:hypothetical protein
MKLWHSIFFTVLLILLPCCKKEEIPEEGIPKAASIESLTINGQLIANGGKTNDLSIDKPVVADIVFSNSIDIAYRDTEKIFIPGVDSADFEITQGSSDKHLILKISKEAFKSYSSYRLCIVSGEHLGIYLADDFFCTLLTGLDPTPKFPIISDEELLTLVQQQTFKYFWDFGHPISGMARERSTSGDIVTTGGTGFGIMAMIVAVERGFITRTQAVERIQTIVSFLDTQCTKYHGAYAHWINGKTGKTQAFSAYDNGGDLVETAFLMQGLLAAREYFHSPDAAEIRLNADITKLWEAVEWTWYQKNSENVLYWHWSLDYEWKMNMKIAGWNEALMVYILAAASPTHPISRDVYDRGWAQNGKINNGKSFYGYSLPLGPDYGGPLFFSHYSFLGLNPTDLKDVYADYWKQNRNHALINYNYCVANPKQYTGYGADCWGLTASDGNNGYNAFSPTNDQGVIAPTAALSSMPYTPEESMQALKFFYYTIGDKLWKEYGFRDAFNLSARWVDNEFLAIDQGPIIVMIENYRTRLIWNLFMQNGEIQSGLTKLGFTR